MASKDSGVMTVQIKQGVRGVPPTLRFCGVDIGLDELAAAQAEAPSDTGWHYHRGELLDAARAGDALTAAFQKACDEANGPPKVHRCVVFVGQVWAHAEGFTRTVVEFADKGDERYARLAGAADAHG